MFKTGFPSEWSTIKKLSWLYRAVINAVPAVLKTVTGNPIHITDALAKPVQALSVKLEPIQDLHGYDNPWPAGGGANKLIENFANGNLDGQGNFVPNNTNISSTEFSEVTPSAEYYFYCGSFTGVKAYIAGYDENKAFVGYIPTESGFNSNRTLAIPSNVHFIKINMGASYGTTYKNDIALNYPATVTTYSPNANICPISGWTGANVHVADGEDPHVIDNIYPITFPDSAGAVYGGTLDVVTGLLTVTHANIASYNGEAINEPWISSIDAFSPGATPTTGAQVVYPLTTPQTYQLTPTEVTLLLGENNLWSDGEMTLVYLADGNASDEEALNILLGGRYVNNHTEDEPTDREALDILLGRDSR